MRDPVAEHPQAAPPQHEGGLWLCAAGAPRAVLFPVVCGFRLILFETAMTPCTNPTPKCHIKGAIKRLPEV